MRVKFPAIVVVHSEDLSTEYIGIYLGSKLLCDEGGKI